MPAGPCLLCLQALVFYAYGPSSLLLIYIAVMSLLLCFLKLQLNILDSNQKSQFFGHVKRPSPRLSFCAASPRKTMPSPSSQRRSFQLPRSPPSPRFSFRRRSRLLSKAPPGSLDSTFKYWIEADIPEVNAVVCVVNACTQISPAVAPGFCSGVPVSARRGTDRGHHYRRQADLSSVVQSLAGVAVAASSASLPRQHPARRSTASSLFLCVGLICVRPTSPCWSRSSRTGAYCNCLRTSEKQT